MAITAESLQSVTLRVFGPQSGGRPTVLAMSRQVLGDWQAQSRKFEVGFVIIHPPRCHYPPHFTRSIVMAIVDLLYVDIVLVCTVGAHDLYLFFDWF